MDVQGKPLNIEHHKEENRFVLDLSEKGEAELKYEVIKGASTDILDFTHTFVPPEMRNRGLGKALVQQGLDFAKQHGFKVKGSCPFVESFLDDHEAYESLRAK